MKPGSAIVWKHLWNEGGGGLEHLILGARNVDSVILWTDESGQPCRLSYELEWDALGCTRRLSARAWASTPSRVLELTADGGGNWSIGEEPAPMLKGCLDVDLWPTPFTNSLPIRRLELDQGVSATFRVAFVVAPELEVSVKEQRYTRVGDDRYLFESVEDAFTSELVVDDDGLVLAYPSLFERIA